MKKDNTFSAVIRPTPKCDNLLDAKWAGSSKNFIQNQWTGKYLMDMSFSSKPPALQPGWIKSHQHAMVQFFCTCLSDPLLSNFY